MHGFSVNHMRTTNSHNTLSARSDQAPLLFAAEIPLPFIKKICQFWFSGRCVSLHSGNI